MTKTSSCQESAVLTLNILFLRVKQSRKYGTTNLIIDTYQRIILESESKLAKVKQHIYRIGTLRLILFAAGIAGIIYFWDEGRLVIGGIAAITFIPFILLVKLHNRLFHQKDYLEKKIEINRQELQALTYDTSAFDNGEEFINPSHLYTYDLDVFGEHSLFQYINRTLSLIHISEPTRH